MLNKHDDNDLMAMLFAIGASTMKYLGTEDVRLPMLNDPGSSMDFVEPSMEVLENFEYLVELSEQGMREALFIVKKLYDETLLLQEAPPFEDEESYRKLVDRQLKNLMSFKYTLSKEDFDQQMKIFRDMCLTQVTEKHNKIEAKKEQARLNGEVYKYKVKQTNMSNIFATATERSQFVQSQLEGFTPTAYPPTLEGKLEGALQFIEFYIYNDDITVKDHMNFFRQAMADRLLWDKTRFEAGHHPEFATFEEMRDKYFEDIDRTKGLKAVFQVE